MVTIGARDVEMSFKDGATELVTLTSGEGLLVLASDGLAGSMTADLDAGRSTAAFGASGSVAIEINTFAAPVTRTVNVGDDVVVINVPGGPLLRVSATDLAIVIAGQTLLGSFHFEKSGDLVAVAASNARQPDPVEEDSRVALNGRTNRGSSASSRLVSHEGR